MYFSIDDRIDRQLFIRNNKIKCPSCDGTGLCWVCNGTGMKTDEQTCGNCIGGICPKCNGLRTIEV